MSIWDEFTTSGNYIKFENVGDSVSGTITNISVKRWDDGKTAPQLEITTDEGEEVTLTAGQYRLQAELRELRPDVGDHLSVIYSADQKLPGGKALKIFVVRVNESSVPPLKGGTVTAYPAVKTAAPPDADPLASLSPEQLAAIKNMSAGGLI
jgi:hypothetical protein